MNTIPAPLVVAGSNPLPKGFVVVSWHRKAPHWVVSYEDTHRRADVVRSWARFSWTEMHDDAVLHIPGGPRGVLVYEASEVSISFDGPSRVALIYP